MGLFSLFSSGPTHDAANDSAWVQDYALADGTFAHQARCSCGWFSDVYVEERQFVYGLRQQHADTGN